MDWNASTQRSIVNVSVSLDMRETISEPTITGFLEKLTKVNYKTESEVALEKQLHGIKQEDYLLINDFGEAIEKTLEKIQVCTGPSKSRIAERISETFLANFNTETINRMKEGGHSSMVGIIRCISQVESKILRKPEFRHGVQGDLGNNLRSEKNIDRNSDGKKECNFYKT